MTEEIKLHRHLLVCSGALVCTPDMKGYGSIVMQSFEMKKRAFQKIQGSIYEVALWYAYHEHWRVALETHMLSEAHIYNYTEDL